MAEGKMFNFSAADKNLVAFVSQSARTGKVCANAVLLVPGLTDGFMSMSYSSQLWKRLEELDYSLVQAQISSSFMQFGFSSIEKDCEELSTLVSFLKEQLKMKKVVLLGHSTGAQDSIYFLGHSPVKEMVDAVVLQGAVGDRDIIASDPLMLGMLEEAKKLRDDDKVDVFLRERLYGAPVTARRFLSLAERLSKEDMFSMDLTEEELHPIFKGVQVPIMLCFSSSDEYVPDQVAQRGLAERLVKVLKENSQTVVECKYYDGDHGLSEEAMYKPFVEDVLNFLKVVCH